MKKILLSSVVFFALSQPAFAWDWLDRQLDVLPTIPTMTELYGMEKKISPDDMVLEEGIAADREAEPNQRVHFKSPEETISGEKRMVLFEDDAQTEDVPVIKSAPAIQNMAVTPKQPAKPPVRVVVPQTVEPVSDGAEDYTIRSDDYYKQQVAPPPAVFEIVEMPLETPEAFVKTEEVAADMQPVQDEVSFNPEERAAQGFTHCQGYGCRVESSVFLTDNEWQFALRAFNLVPIENPKQERMAIAIYIGEMEKIVGAKTDSLTDVGGTFSGFAKAGQLDCQDEATNTGTYLSLLDNERLLQFYSVGKMAGRGFFSLSGGWPHQSATIVEKDSGQVYAVDSWFEDNGVMPYILPIEQWKDGWSPDDMAKQDENQAVR